jgi:uncharacterized protein YkwD
MNKTIPVQTAVSSLAIALALSACGGGGGGGDSSSVSNASQSNSPTPVSLLAVAASPTALPATTGNAAYDGATYLNITRQNVGLPALRIDSRLLTASTDHSTYLVDNLAIGHTETAGLAGFTGADPFVRMSALGTFTTMGEVVVAGVPAAFPSSATAVQAIFDAPFHRIGMLDDFQIMGVGEMENASWNAFTIDFANAAGAIPANALVAFPYSNQQDAPTSWFASESPNPFASAPQYENTVVGYPVTIESSFVNSLSSIAFTITDASGNNVPCLAQTPQTTPSELTNGALCVPYTAFKPNATYSVHVTGTLTNLNSGKASPIDLAWSFKTGGVAQVSLHQGAATKVHPTID